MGQMEVCVEGYSRRRGYEDGGRELFLHGVLREGKNLKKVAQLKQYHRFLRNLLSRLKFFFIRTQTSAFLNILFQICVLSFLHKSLEIEFFIYSLREVTPFKGGLGESCLSIFPSVVGLKEWYLLQLSKSHSSCYEAWFANSLCPEDGLSLIPRGILPFNIPGKWVVCFTFALWVSHFSLHLLLPWGPMNTSTFATPGTPGLQSPSLGCPDPSSELQGGGEYHHPSLYSPTVNSQQSSTHSYVNPGKGGGTSKGN